MPETFFLLLAGGILLAAAIPKPATVTLHWLRLAGILSLCMSGLSLFFYLYNHPPSRPDLICYALMITTILAQLAFTQVGQINSQRLCAIVAAVVSIQLAHLLLIPYPSALGIAAMTGLVLMDMLLGHAYLTASRMTMAPFLRLTRALAGVLLARAVAAIALPLWLQHARPVEMLWGLYGLYILTRWLVGLAVPAVFVYMTYDCVRRRATQSATGILYVAGVLIFIGEIIALYLVRQTGLPF